MGGKAIKNSIRISISEYLKIKDILVPKLQDIFGMRVLVTRHLHEKQDFGDMDIIVEVLDQDMDIRQILIDNFGEVDIHHNSNTWSFGYNGFQIDLILTKPENVITAFQFMSHGDLGNFVGKLVNNYGKLKTVRLRYGFDGLKFSVYAPNSTNKLGSVYISKDLEKIYEFYDLSYSKFLEGFNNIEDVFKFVMNSKYFDSESYQYENLNHENKNRNKRRPNYLYFIQWMVDNNVSVIKTFDESEDFYINAICEFFSPDGRVKNEMYKLILDNEQRKLEKEKFNGSHIMKYFNISGVEVGKKLEEFQSSFSSIEEYRKFIIYNTLEDIFKRMENVI